MVKFDHRAIDYSLYLVTGRRLLPDGKDYYESLEESLKGGVTVVQVREKNIDTGEFVEIARKTKEITDKYNVPLFINDRVDVCLAVGAAGLHVGQTDMPVDLARSLLPEGTIIGLSVSNVKEAQAAVESGLVDYVGIGAVWWTGSKDLKGKLCLGVDGVGEVLDVLAEGEKQNGKVIKTVAIGGIHLPNLPQLLHGCPSPKHLKSLDGIALISDIVGSTDPENAARKLRTVLDSYHRVRKDQAGLHAAFGLNAGGEAGYVKRSGKELLEAAAGLIEVVRESTPLAHQITNIVVANDSANATLAMGGSPIMASAEQEVGDLSKVISGLLINFGTIKDRAGMLIAGKAANINKKPIVFDPVAVGATAFRRETSKELLHAWQPSVIKGNAAEIGALAESAEVASRGVDSVGSGFANPAEIVKSLARKRRCVVALTGKEDWVSDGQTVVKLSNGHEYLGVITGSGCMTGSAITVYTGAASQSVKQAYENESQIVQGDIFAATIAGILVINVAAEIAAARPDVKGPNTFRSALIDELYHLRADALLEKAKVEVVES